MESSRYVSAHPAFTVLIAAAVCLAAGGAGADTFVPVDEIVSAPGVPLSDPEFDEVGNRVAWQFGPNAQVTGTLLVADVDPDTGEILDPTTGVSLREGGRALVIGQGLAERTATGNGPEWALGIDGGQIVYTLLNAQGAPALGLATFDGAGWEAGPVAFGDNRFTPKGSRFADDPTPRVAYYGFVNGPSGLEVRLAARVIGRPGSEVTTPVRTGGGNFLPNGEPVFITTALAATGLPQAYVFDVETGAFDQVTFDGGAKLQSPEPWIAPDVEGDMLFTVNVRFGPAGQARVYRRPDDQDNLLWEPLVAIDSPVPDKPYIKSPRPFVFEGKSYLVFIVQPGPGRSTAGEIWISDLEPDPATRFMRKVSEGDPGETDVRFDPETFITPQGPIIFYTHVIDGVPVLRRAQTGIAPAPAAPPVATFTATPNPAAAGANVDFDGSGSSDPDGAIVSWDWDFDDDGVFDANGTQVVASYPAPGAYTARLRVTDDTSLTDETTLTIDVTEAP
jgi:hypothetical protein